MTRSSYLVLTFLANAVWQVTLVAGVAGCGAWLLRRAPARYRHGLWVAALLIGLALPLSSLRGFRHDARERLGHVEYPHVAAGESVAGRPSPARQPDVGATTLAGRSISLAGPTAFAVVGLYALFFLYRSFRLWQAWRRTEVIRRASYPATLPASLETVIKRYGDELGVGRSDIRVSRSVDGPMTLGALRPAVILPEHLLNEARADVLAAALGHELAHIRRRDFASNLVYELLFLPLSFHPAAVQLKRGIDRTRELACDEVVSERLMEARDYARSLVCLAESASSPRPAACALGIRGADNLEERVMRLMNRSALSGVRSGRALAAVAAAMLCTACVIAGFLSVRVSGSTQERNDSAKQNDSARQSGGVTSLREQALAPGSLLREAMELNRAGRWREAAQLAEAVTRWDAASHAERCEAYVSAAYSYNLLKETGRGLEAVKLFQAECSDLPDSSWQREEARRIGNLLNGIEPITAMDLNRTGKWARAAEVAEGVLSAGGASHAERCAAHVDAAYAYVRLKRHELAKGQLRQFEEGCGDLPTEDWLRAEVGRLKAEVE